MSTDTTANPPPAPESLAELLDRYNVDRGNLAHRRGVRRGSLYRLLNGFRVNIRALPEMIAGELDIKPSIVHQALAETKRRAVLSESSDASPLIEPQHLSELRALRRLTQAALAKKAGVAEMTISMIENGTKPHGATVHALARGLKMDIHLVRRACRISLTESVMP